MKPSNRPGTRPRPLEVGKKLVIVRDERELEDEAEADVEAAAKEALADTKKLEAASKPKEVDIPIPPVTNVPTYNTDYLPLHEVGLTYLRAPSKAEAHEKEYTEYDLDLDDQRILREINQDGQDRLTDRNMEMLLWKLEVSNAEATERSMSQAGATAAERSAVSAAAATEYLPKGVALDLMLWMCRCQDHIVERVYDYWKEKRKAQQRPSLRRLQAPTPESETNPFCVFRIRTKPNRPQTRRRRESQDESLEKLRTLRQNLESSLKLAKMVCEREHRKLVIANLTVDAQQYMLRKVCDRTPVDELDRRVMAALKLKPPGRAFDPRPLPKAGDRVPGDRGVGPPLMDAREAKKRKIGKRLPRLDAISEMPLPPPAVQPTMGFLYDLSQEEMRRALKIDLLEDDNLRRKVADGSVVVRMGRSGRVCFDEKGFAADADERSDNANGTASAAAAAAATSSSPNGVTSDKALDPLMERLAIALWKV